MVILRDVFVLYLILVQIIDYFIVRDYIPLFHLFKMKNFDVEMRRNIKTSRTQNNDVI